MDLRMVYEKLGRRCPYRGELISWQPAAGGDGEKRK